MQHVTFKAATWKWWAAAGLSAGLLELPFPFAGPLPPWRSVFAWFGLVPLLWAVLSSQENEAPKPLRRAFLISYICGVLWYAGNCYWVRDVMLQYGDMPPLAPELLLLGFSLVLGAYFGLFGLAVALVRRATKSNGLALTAAPVFWAGLELAASRITSVPWDQLGYSQVDNALVNQLAPWTGVYGISFLLVAANALLAAGLTLDGRAKKLICASVGIVAFVAGSAGLMLQPPPAATSATAVLIQPNLDVGASGLWTDAAEWNQHIATFVKLADEQCKSYIAGIPQTGALSGEVVCPPYTTHPDLVAWPESPAPYFEGDPRYQKAVAFIAQATKAPLIVGSFGMDYRPEGGWSDFNSAIVMSPTGARVGRYDKIHLVPFGEYVPFSRLLFFARKLTGKVSKFNRGEDRKVFRLATQSGTSHRYGVFICYEAVFADEVRQFAQMGAEVLVNISDDAWYGDTSAPWQHLNMARMRAIENRRWILRDTNNGVTASIDPYGRVRQSIPRHVEDALPAQYGFRDDMTFYSEHGDVFAFACAILGLVAAGWSGRRILSESLRRNVKSKARL
jgi:apolipoprotein N-acyltransferase